MSFPTFPFHAFAKNNCFSDFNIKLSIWTILPEWKLVGSDESQPSPVSPHRNPDWSAESIHLKFIYGPR